jgi:hypothetical protein
VNPLAGVVVYAALAAAAFVLLWRRQPKTRDRYVPRHLATVDSDGVPARS